MMIIPMTGFKIFSRAKYLQNDIKKDGSFLSKERTVSIAISKFCVMQNVRKTGILYRQRILDLKIMLLSIDICLERQFVHAIAVRIDGYIFKIYPQQTK